MFNLQPYTKSLISSLRLGDYLVVLGSLLLIVYLFATLWSSHAATKLQIRLGDKVLATYSLNIQREIHVHGKIGDSTVMIANGKARFLKSPCRNQYCVHQGWLTRAGQATFCLPNQLSLVLLGDDNPYDSLAY